MDRTAFREGFIAGCGNYGITDEDLILGLYKQALCACKEEGRMPYYDIEGAADENERLWDATRGYQGLGDLVGTPMMDISQLAMEETPEYEDPDERPIVIAGEGADPPAIQSDVLDMNEEEGVEEPAVEALEEETEEESEEAERELEEDTTKEAYWKYNMFRRR